MSENELNDIPMTAFVAGDVEIERITDDGEIVWRAATSSLTTDGIPSV